MSRKATDNPPLNTEPMRVSASWGHRFRLVDESDPSAAPVQARARGKRLRPVCGDQVLAVPLDGESDWLIERILERRNELARPDLRGRREVLAANIDTVVVVACSLPAADWFIVDRYLAAARLMDCRALVVWNKADIEAPPEALSVFAAIGYQTIVTSPKTGQGIDQLAAALSGQRSIFVGQSGVGKSSLINALADEDRQRTSAISEGNKEGRHTTVAAELLRLGHDIAVIDSPGVRDYAPSIESLADVAIGFIEISQAADDCRFANCMHRAEPGCAVKQAVADGRIDERRYASFLRLVQLTRQLNEGRH